MADPRVVVRWLTHSVYIYVYMRPCAQGFVRVAMAAGASIVPVLFFGEPDTYEVTKAAPGSLLDRFQKLLMRTGGFTMPIFTGRLAVFPYQATITGAPS